MPRRALVDRFCRHASAAKDQPQTDYFDEACKGLALRVGSSGSKSWTYHFTWGGKRSRMTFGTYPATSLAKARTLADEARAALAEGRDPRTQSRASDTLQSICEEWASREAGALRTGADITAVLARAVYPVLGDRAVADIRRSDIVRMLDKIEDERGPVAETAPLASRRIFNWHTSRSDDFRSPVVRGMSRIKPHERARSRILSETKSE